MELRPTTRYPSLAMVRGVRMPDPDGAAPDHGPGAVAIDGLDVVDEQVVELSPVQRKDRGNRRGGTSYRGRDGDHAVG
jgi:hypothetical protein